MTRRDALKTTAAVGAVLASGAAINAAEKRLLADVTGTVEQGHALDFSDSASLHTPKFALRKDAAEVGWVAFKNPEATVYGYTLAMRAAATNKKIKITFESFDGNFYRGVTKMELV